MTESQLRGFTVLTRCQTVEEFIDQFHDRTGTHHAYARTIFVHTVDARVVGTECGFAVLLANKKPVLGGTCIVLDVFRDASNPFKRPGMRLGVKRLGPESDSVFTALEAARELRAQPDTFVDALPLPPPDGRAPLVPITPVASAVPRRDTQPLRVVTTTDGTVELVTPRRTERIGSRDLVVPQRPAQARAATVQIPVAKVPAREELTRTPRGTSPRHLTTEEAKPPEPPKRDVPKHVSAEGSAVTRTAETRTPGSSIVLPANPLMNMDDASLEGLVDGWGESKPKAVAPAALPVVEPAIVEPAVVQPAVVEPAIFASAVVAPAILEPPSVVTAVLEPPSVVTAVLEPDDADVAYIVEARVVDVAPVVQAPTVAAVAPVASAPVVPRPLPTLSSSLRRPLAIAAAVLVATAALVFWMRDGRSVAYAPSITVESAEDVALGVRATAELDPLPPAPPAPPPPAAPIKIHAVLVKTYPNGALVTVNGRSFGTTPTYVKVPAFVPVELHITRAGFPKVVHKLTSKTTTDRVFLVLRRRR
ncbi:MAG: PEGA domain-containing protein [Myxococcota bacterium]|nr:PEGA domain-containing protein [Myxococcota bacterium]